MKALDGSNIDALYGEWVRSKEEDTDQYMVYRRSSYAFPPSRGREGLSFFADGSFKRSGVGPTDIAQVKSGSWRRADRNSNVLMIDGGEKVEQLDVLMIDGDRLLIRKNLK